MSDNFYYDQEGIAHIKYDTDLCVLWRELMKYHMDKCYAAGLDSVQSANLLINGAAYLIGASLSEDRESREKFKKQLVDIFERKVEQSVLEGREDRKNGKAV